MTVTSSQSMNPASVANIAVGAYLTDGTAAAVTITTGFQPRYVKVVNTNASGLVMVEWFEAQADAAGIKTASNGDRTTLTTLGITPSSSGFIIGLDTDLNVTNEQMYWLALG